MVTFPTIFTSEYLKLCIYIKFFNSVFSYSHQFSCTNAPNVRAGNLIRHESLPHPTTSSPYRSRYDLRKKLFDHAVMHPENLILLSVICGVKEVFEEYLSSNMVAEIDVFIGRVLFYVTHLSSLVLIRKSPKLTDWTKIPEYPYSDSWSSDDWEKNFRSLINIYRCGRLLIVITNKLRSIVLFFPFSTSSSELPCSLFSWDGSVRHTQQWYFNVELSVSTYPILIATRSGWTHSLGSLHIPVPTIQKHFD